MGGKGPLSCQYVGGDNGNLNVGLETTGSA